MFQHQYEHLFEKVVHAFLRDREMGTLQFLAYLPYQHLSLHRAWHIFTLIFTDNSEHSKSVEIRSAEDWFSVVHSQPKFRESFIQLMQEDSRKNSNSISPLTHHRIFVCAACTSSTSNRIPR